DRGRIDNLDDQAGAEPLQQAVDPVRQRLEIARQVIRQCRGGFLSPQLFADSHLLERQLAVLTVVEDGRRVGNDLDRHGLHLKTSTNGPRIHLPNTPPAERVQSGLSAPSRGAGGLAGDGSKELACWWIRGRSSRKWPGTRQWRRSPSSSCRRSPLGRARRGQVRSRSHA